MSAQDDGQPEPWRTALSAVKVNRVARDVLVPLSCLLILFAGSFKASPFLAWIPVDLTLLAGLIVLAGVVGVFIAEGLDFRISPWFLVLLVTIIPAWVPVSIGGAYSTSKLSGMIL